MGAVADFPVAGRGPKSPRRVALMVPRHRPRSAVPKWSSMVKRTSGIAWKIAEKKALISGRPRAVPPGATGVVVHRVWGVELVYQIRAAAVDDFLHVSPGEVCCCALRHVVPLSAALLLSLEELALVRVWPRGVSRVPQVRARWMRVWHRGEQPSAFLCVAVQLAPPMG